MAAILAVPMTGGASAASTLPYGFVRPTVGGGWRFQASRFGKWQGVKDGKERDTASRAASDGVVELVDMWSRGLDLYDVARKGFRAVTK